MKITAWTKNSKDLKAASSGGIFYELAKQVIADGGLVCGVVMDDLVPQFIMSDNINDVNQMRGSKYLWADPNNIYKHINGNRLILFVGLPCQIVTLKRYLKHKGISDKKITYVSLRCHGVIKESIFKDHIKRLGKPVQKIIFRSKVNGWKGAGFGFSYEGINIFYKPKLIKDYIKQRNVPTRCKHCNIDRNNSDITLGDAWGVHPALKNKYGTSVMEINTRKGYDLFFSIAPQIIWKYMVPSGEIPVDSDKIGLLKVADIKNFGNLMLSSNFITHMKKINEYARFVFIEEYSAKETMERETGLDNIDYRSLIDSPLEFFKRIVNPKDTNLVKTFADCRCVVILGGDYLTNKWKYKAWISNLVKIRALTKSGKHVHVVSNTIGDFPILLKPFIKFVFNTMTSIYCRDMDSVERCVAIGVHKNVHYAPDLAFLPLKNESKYDMLEEIKGTYCTITTSTLWSRYATTYKDYIQGVKWMGDNLHKTTGKDIIILPHSIYKKDIQIAKDVAKGSPFMTTLKDTKNATPSSIRNILGNSYLNISFRMHSAISSLVTGVPVVAIAYSHKYKGVIADGYDLPELVVKKMKRKDWAHCVFKTTLSIQYAIKYYGTITAKIRDINEERVWTSVFPLNFIKEDRK